MKLRYLIVAVLLSLCSASVLAEPVVLGHPNAKIAATIALHNVNPSSVMWKLNLFNLDDLKSGNVSMWQRDKKAAAGNSVPQTIPVIDSGNLSLSSTTLNDILSRIDLIVPSDSEHVLVVYGEKSAIKDLRNVVSSMDVAHKNIQIKAEFFKIPVDEVKKIDIEKFTQEGIDKSQIGDFKKMLEEHGVEFTNSPVISTIDDYPAVISISSDSRSSQLSVLPKVNSDNSITLATNVSVTDSPDRKQELYTQRRISAGDSILLGGFILNDNQIKELMVLITPNVID